MQSSTSTLLTSTSLTSTFSKSALLMKNVLTCAFSASRVFLRIPSLPAVFFYFYSTFSTNTFLTSTFSTSTFLTACTFFIQVPVSRVLFFFSFEYLLDGYRTAHTCWCCTHQRDVLTTWHHRLQLSRQAYGIRMSLLCFVDNTKTKKGKQWGGTGKQKRAER